jgi:hypothetical protein
VDYLEKGVDDPKECNGIREFFLSYYGVQADDPNDVRPAIDDYVRSRDDDHDGALLMAEVDDLIERNFPEGVLSELIEKKWLSQGGVRKYGTFANLLLAVRDYLRSKYQY